jgi:hypothetical protein
MFVNVSYFPEFDQAACAMRRFMPMTPIIVFSEYSDVFSEREARNTGVAALVSKTERLFSVSGTGQSGSSNVVEGASGCCDESRDRIRLGDHSICARHKSLFLDESVVMRCIDNDRHHRHEPL